VLGNCPFHALAREHTQTVCGMNQHLLRGVLHGLGERAYTACPSPAPGPVLRPVGARRLTGTPASPSHRRCTSRALITAWKRIGRAMTGLVACGCP
jgi:hypothetical protein